MKSQYPILVNTFCRLLTYTNFLTFKHKVLLTSALVAFVKDSKNRNN